MYKRVDARVLTRDQKSTQQARRRVGTIVTKNGDDSRPLGDYTLCLKKGTPTLSTELLKGLADFDDSWHKYS